MNGCQGTPWSEELRSLMARNSTERLGGEYDPESRESAFSCTACQ